jgi:hypothetical protein
MSNIDTFQSSVSRTSSRMPLLPSDESLGYCGVAGRVERSVQGALFADYFTIHDSRFTVLRSIPGTPYTTGIITISSIALLLWRRRLTCWSCRRLTWWSLWRRRLTWWSLFLRHNLVSGQSYKSDTKENAETLIHV